MANDNINYPIVTPAAAKAIILAAYNAPGKHPVMLWGPPGVGKTAIAYQAAEEIGGRLIDFRLVTTEPVDLRGYPVVVKDEAGRPTGMCWVPPELLPRDGKGILMLDELAQAPTMNLNAASELIYDRKMGNDYVLPEGWMVVAASNRRSDRAGTVEIPTHIKNRLTHLEVAPDLEGWCAWATAEGLPKDLIAFLRATPKLFHKFEPDHNAFPTPRSWHFVADYMTQTHLPKDIRRALICGVVGRGAGTEFEAYIDRGKSLPTYQDIVANPTTASVGSLEGESYALVTLVAHNAKMEDLDAICTYFKRHRRELYRPGVHVMVTQNPDFLNNDAFRALADSFGKDR